MEKINLTWKYVNDITGDFIVPDYQRGYRWDETEVNRLLDDIYNLKNLEDKNYCLQPIVVKKVDDKYELIDGQQRLTTIYLIYKYLNKCNAEEYEAPKFSLVYQNRNESATFLTNMDMSLRNKYIDFFFMANAYEAVENWFKTQKPKPSTARSYIDTYFTENVKIIWYEIEQSDDDKDSIKMFTRLNVGKIPLTSSELVKAMFLRENGSSIIRQDEIALQWDNIERELHDESFFCFLTNDNSRNYPTRIDLILDLMSRKPVNNKEDYYTYFYFDDLQKQYNLKDIWQKIVHTFLILKDWYINHKFYHKIGYLIASKSKTLSDIFDEYQKSSNKNEFINKLNEYIKDSIKSNDYANLVYGTNSTLIYRILLLFNVESVNKIGDESQRFPFDKFKFNEKGKTIWSLEHIHAQQSQGLDTEKQWLKWLELHKPSIEALDGNNNNLINSIKKYLDKGKISGEEFKNLHKQIVDKLSTDNGEYMNTIANLALLDVGDNSALKNATFDVKRDLIINMDMAGKFIPFCTKMVFLKYYTPSNKNQIHFWAQADRNAYINKINEVLKKYLMKPITL